MARLCFVGTLTLSLLVAVVSAQPVAFNIMRFQDNAEVMCIGSKLPVISPSSLNGSPDDKDDFGSDSFPASAPQFLYVGSKASFGAKHRCTDSVDFYTYDPISNAVTPTNNVPSSILSASFIFSLSLTASAPLSVTVLNQSPDQLTVPGVIPSIYVPGSSQVSALVTAPFATAVADPIASFAGLALTQKGKKAFRGAIIMPPDNSGVVYYVSYRIRKSCDDIAPGANSCMDGYSASIILSGSASLATRKAQMGRKLLSYSGVGCPSWHCWYTAQGRQCSC